jgi:oligopeptide transport system ATP-binding protein
MYCGKVVESGTVTTIIEAPAHPYTVGLLQSIPRIAGSQQRLEQIPGMVPSPFDLPPGCKFAPRCRFCQAVCNLQEPPAVVVREGHSVSCHFPLKGGVICE